MPEVASHTGEIDGSPVFWRQAAAPEGTSADVAPALYLHGVPTSSDDWVAPLEHHGTRPWRQRWWRRKRGEDEWVELPAYAQGFLERSGGIAPDLPGFGRSGKSGYLKYTIEEYADFIEHFLDMLEVPRVRMVVHDWGAVGLAFAQRHPERIERLVVMNAVTFLPGYRWHRTARIWRTPLLGELAMGTSTRWVFEQSTRESNAKPGPMPGAWIDSVLAHFDEGTQRAILRLYRSSPSDVLAAAGAGLGTLRVPALVVWGERDPYIPTRFAREYADVLGAELLSLPDAGHWWWFDRPDAIARVVEFLTAP
jgi:pimeloyl-ACP methyl ester carboxylesterase